MLHSFQRFVQLLLLISTMGLGGCANLMETMPAPPGFLAPIQLSGPYDADIPVRQINQIKRASLIKDWAVPYIFLSVGSHFESAGDDERSIHFFNRALDEFQKKDNVSGEGSAFSRKISVLIRFGHFQTAYLAIEELGRKWTKAPFNAFVFYNYGYYYLKNGDYAKAREYFRQALAANAGNDSHDPDLMALRRDTELMCGMVPILADYFSPATNRLGLLDFDEDFYQDVRRNISEGIFHLEQISALNAKIQNTKVRRYFPEMIPSTMECDVFNYLGLSYGIARKTPEAVSNIETARGIARKTGYLLGEADSIFFLNQVYLLDKNRPEGFKAAHLLAETADRHQLVPYAIWANMIFAHHTQATGDSDRTIKAMDKALTLMEENVSWLLFDADFRGIKRFNRQVIYEALLELYVSKNDKKMAFQTAERSKAARLADRLSEEATGKASDLSQDIKQIFFYRKQLTQQYNMLLSPASSSTAFMDAVEKINKARTDHEKLLAGLKERDELLYSFVRVSVPEAENLQRLLDDNTTLFAYFAAKHGLYIWVISQNGFHQEKIQIFRHDVDRLVYAYRSALMSKDKIKADVAAEKVYDTFLKRAIPFVYGDRIGFVPHGTLYNLPFASLRYVQSYLVDGFTVFNLPHAGLLKPLLKRKSSPDIENTLILADARCVEKQQSAVYAGAEMDVLKKMFPQADYFVNTGSSQNDHKLTGNYASIHWVLYDGFTEDTLSDSRPLLASAGQDDGNSCFRDIFRLQLSAGLAVSSVCRAERVLSAKPTGMSVWTSAWLFAVSPQVVTQLWEVEDKDRAALMKIFYGNLKKNISAADALRAAQNEMIQKGYEPSEWAAFILNGRY